MGQKGGVLHAMVREVEPGLFSAEYRGELNQEEGGPQAFPDTHLGDSPESVRMWVEQMATGMGYDQVIWDSDPTSQKQ